MIASGDAIRSIDSDMQIIFKDNNINVNYNDNDN